jgi:hypothetical protein
MRSHPHLCCNQLAIESGTRVKPACISAITALSRLAHILTSFSQKALSSVRLHAKQEISAGGFLDDAPCRGFRSARDTRSLDRGFHSYESHEMNLNQVLREIFKPRLRRSKGFNVSEFLREKIRGVRGVDKAGEPNSVKPGRACVLTLPQRTGARFSLKLQPLPCTGLSHA